MKEVWYVHLHTAACSTQFVPSPNAWKTSATGPSCIMCIYTHIHVYVHSRPHPSTHNVPGSDQPGSVGGGGRAHWKTKSVQSHSFLMRMHVRIYVNTCTYMSLANLGPRMEAGNKQARWDDAVCTTYGVCTTYVRIKTCTYCPMCMYAYMHICTHTQNVPDAGQPGSVVVGKEPIVLNAGRRGVEISVTNMADRPIQVYIYIYIYIYTHTHTHMRDRLFLYVCVCMLCICVGIRGFVSRCRLMNERICSWHQRFSETNERGFFLNAHTQIHSIHTSTYTYVREKALPVLRTGVRRHLMYKAYINIHARRMKNHY